MVRRTRKRWLSQLVFAMTVVMVLAGGAFKAWNWLSGHRDAGKAEARTAETVEQARILLDEGRVEEAAFILAPMAERRASTDILMLLARTEEQLGNQEGALDLLRRAATDFKNDAMQPRAAIAYARKLEEFHRFDEAVAVFASVRAKTAPAVRAPAVVGLGRHAERAGNLVDARNLYAAALDDAVWDSPEWEEALDALGRANVALIFDSARTPEAKSYTVQKGDTLTSIGSKLNTTVGLLTRANGISEDAQLIVGQTLKHTPKDFRIVIERAKCRLFLFDKGGVDDTSMFKRYSIALGRTGHETTLGLYTIGNKVKDPTWQKPGEGLIPAGDPRNELGSRWIPLVPARENLPTDLGIHGTANGNEIGHHTTLGSARMSTSDIEELFDLVVRGTPVEIVEHYTPGQGI